MRVSVPTVSAFKRSRWYRRLLWAGACFLAYLLLGFFALPPMIKSQLLKRLPPITKRQVAIRQVKFNPLALSLTVRGLALTEPGGQVAASWEELYVNFQLSSLLRFAWTFDEVSLKQPFGHLILAQDGQLNFANMAGSSNAPPPRPITPQKSGGLPRVNVWRLHIDDGAVVWEDHTHRVPQRIELKPINLALTNLTTRVGKDSIYSFKASSDSGKSLAWAGTLMVQPLQSRGHLELAGAEVSKWTPLLRDYLRAEITDGTLNLRADYDLRVGTNGPHLAVTNGALELGGFKVKDLNNGERLTAISSLAITPLDANLQQRTLHIGQIKLDGFTKVVRIEKDGSLNLNLLLEPSPTKTVATNTAPSTPPAPWTLTVDDFTMGDASISFADLSRRSPFQTTLNPVRLRVQHFTTRPDSDAAYEFSIPTEAGEALAGQGTFSMAPLRSAGAIHLKALEIKNYAPYFQDLLRGEVLAGKLGAGLEYRFAASSNAPLLTVSNAGIALTGFQLKDADTGETVVGIPSFTAERSEASLGEHSIQVGLIKSDSGSIILRQKHDGAINLLGLANPPTAKAASTNTAKSSEPPWTVLLKEIAFTNYSIQVEDQKPAKPAALGVDQIAFNLKGVSNLSNAQITVSLFARCNQAGTVAVAGAAKLAPPMAELEVSVSDLDLRPFQPYVNDSVRLTITSGRFNSRGHLRYTPPGAGAPLVNFAGDLGLNNFMTTDQVLFKEFLKWDALNVSGIDLDLQPNQLKIQEAKWSGLATSVIIGPDQRPNLQTILPEKAAAGPVALAATNSPAAIPGSAQAQSAEFPVQLHALVLENAAFHFADESIEPHGAFDVQEFGGTVQGLSSQEHSTATVDLHGKVDAAAPFSVVGKVNPLARDLALDLAVAFTNTDLTAFTTYLEKYAGYPLNKGKLSMALQYDLNQKQLKAKNKFLVDHLTLGPRNESTNATHLPVKLAVALLKDRNGQINLDIPVTGRTDDPQFKLAPIIFKVVVNLIEKAALSPFSMLGALVGGGEELSFVEFAPGEAVISEVEAQKVEKLVKALQERPALSLEIAGSFDPDKDRPALARSKLEAQLKVLRRGELSKAGSADQSLDTLPLEPAQRERWLREIFTNLGTNQTLVLESAPVAQTNTLAAAPGTIPIPSSNPVSHAKRFTRSALPGAPAADAKGSLGLTAGTKRPAVGEKPADRTQVPTSPASAPLTLEQIEAKLIGAVQLSEAERRDLVKQRAQAVQAFILKTGKIAADRLFITSPKPTSPAPKGEARANLSLS